MKLSPRRLAIAIIAGAILASLVGLLDYLAGGAKDPHGILGRAFPSPSAYPEMPSAEIEARLDALVSHLDEARNAEPPFRFAFEGCLAIVFRDFGRESCRSDTGWWRRETRFDLRLVTTDPRQVTVRPLPPRDGVAAASISLPVASEAAARLKRAYDLYRSQIRKEMAQERASGVVDVPARLARLDSFQREEMAGDLYARMGQRWSDCSGNERTVPDFSDRVLVFALPEDAEEIVSLLHAYAVRECPFDPSALSKD